MDRKWYRKHLSKFLVSLITLGFGVVLIGWVISQQGESLQYPDHELTGSVQEVEEAFMQLTEDTDGSFIYMFEPGCEQCHSMSEVFLPLAQQMDVSIKALNVDKYPIGKEVADVHEFPYITYFNDGWEIAYMEGENPEEYYMEFFDHFRFGGGHDHH
ncbi:hypothetical protein KFZ56_07035 [Virgibacillus sp. NKC19-3]|uniref:thioredoxin domain-containing protein n=1 Tax=Virgibacillus saliphilus TaxID=2831674 RepID=UPI001C9A5030|nr:thioredoxin domain-containing protein [Virgibacillus sp. NKC19-3]MBY7142817.1 hypothetical protein [Virgibacillus sp. NKC19-3]